MYNAIWIYSVRSPPGEHDGCNHREAKIHKNVLIIGAYCDDAELGAGGTAARHCGNIGTYQSNSYICKRPFYPTAFFDITDHIELKSQALEPYGVGHQRYGTEAVRRLKIILSATNYGSILTEGNRLRAFALQTEILTGERHMNPKVTIVIPVYNGSNYMREAIDSALAQSYENIEVVVVNDGSTDNTEEIALSYGSRIRYFSKENGGVSTALNVGIEQMTGEFFQYLPHDDLLHPDKIKLQIEAIQKTGNEMAIAWSGWNGLREPGHRVRRFNIPFWYPRSCWTKGVYPLFFGLLNAASVLLNRKYFTQSGGFDPALLTSQDYDMCFRTFGTQETVYIDQPLVNYRFHDEQGTQAKQTFIKNCQDLAWKFLRNLTLDEINAVFSSQYHFYFAIAKYYREVGWEELLAYAVRQLSQAEEPEAGVKRREELINEFTAESHPLVLYGAGINGRRLREELWLYGIEPFAWCDSDPKKAGTQVDGLYCMGPEELDPDAPVILTMDRPEPVRDMLAARGCARIFDNPGIVEELWRACPVKERALEFLQGDC